jgi:hypothetical protein
MGFFVHANSRIRDCQQDIPSPAARQFDHSGIYRDLYRRPAVRFRLVRDSTATA